MYKFSKLLSALMISSLLLVTGCATWWSNFKKDPVAQIDSVVQTVQRILSIADIVFGQVKPALPADKQLVAQQKYDQAVVAANLSLSAVQSAVKAAAEAKQDNPNFIQVLADLQSSVANVQAVVNEFKTLASMPPTDGSMRATPVLVTPIGFDMMNNQVSALKLQLSQK